MAYIPLKSSLDGRADWTSSVVGHKMMDNLSSLSQNRDPLTHTIMEHRQHALLAARAKATQGLCAARRTNGQFQEKSDQPESTMWKLVGGLHHVSWVIPSVVLSMERVQDVHGGALSPSCLGIQETSPSHFLWETQFIKKMYAGPLKITFSFRFRLKVSHLSCTHFQRVTKGFFLEEDTQPRLTSRAESMQNGEP